MAETPAEMAERIEREARSVVDPDDRAYGLMVASVIRKKASTEKEG